MNANPATTANKEAATREPAPLLLHGRERILAVLHRLRVTREPLSLRRHGGFGAHASIVLAVNPATGLDLDAPQPALAVSSGDVLSVRGRVDGGDLRFTCPVLGAAAVGGHPALRVELPTEIALFERRAAHRVRLLPNTTVTASMGDEAHALRLTDLSHLGAGAHTRRDAAIESGDLLQLRLHLPDTEVDTAAEVRSTRPAAGRLHLGLRFAGLHREARQRLAQALHRIERQLIRRARGLI
ncbi:flagellar brake protein [Sinimarinibacterium thermocellulolyticum]|uniref:PilZ domain-containing protein n=1 Tax=Sinimarinibacterium thermocellulolyticum TaxID=3170016 RepID=A0ABV2AA34_9GAMM